MPELKKKKSEDQKCYVITHVFNEDKNTMDILLTHATLKSDMSLTGIDKSSFLVPFIFPHYCRIMWSKDNRVCVIAKIADFKEKVKLGDFNYENVVELAMPAECEVEPITDAAQLILDKFKVHTSDHWE